MKDMENKILLEHMARAGHDSHWEEKFLELHPSSIERALWLQIAEAMLNEVKRHGHYKE